MRRTSSSYFYSRPCGRGDRTTYPRFFPPLSDFYSRPCGRGDPATMFTPSITIVFLLTPLREGRQEPYVSYEIGAIISTHAPAGGATMRSGQLSRRSFISTHAPAGGATRAVPVYRTRPQKPFLLTPLREGRRAAEIYSVATKKISTHAPAGGATDAISPAGMNVDISTHAPAGGATGSLAAHEAYLGISTHAPAGGATAIFHKSVMRFCGKLPKDDTVLCLASFGFPRRDPKAVYLAWISCANLPQKCVRQGLALKDQSTSCFHEGLASHAFDPVLV